MGIDKNYVSDKEVGRMMGPGTIDTQIREALRWCWITMPPEKRTVGNVEAQFRRLVERAIRDLKEDADAFGVEPKEQK